MEALHASIIMQSNWKTQSIDILRCGYGVIAGGSCPDPVLSIYKPAVRNFAVNETMKKKKKICAVGTPLLKVLESFSPHIDSISATEKWTNKFIYPPYEAKIVNALLTNFHPPRTIPFINTLALGGDKLIMKAYKTAIKENYRFSVYGDALLIV